MKILFMPVDDQQICAAIFWSTRAYG